MSVYMFILLLLLVSGSYVVRVSYSQDNGLLYMFLFTSHHSLFYNTSSHIMTSIQSLHHTLLRILILQLVVPSLPFSSSRPVRLHSSPIGSLVGSPGWLAVSLSGGLGRSSRYTPIYHLPGATVGIVYINLQPEYELSSLTRFRQF